MLAPPRDDRAGAAARALALAPAHVLAIIRDVESAAFLVFTLQLLVAGGLASLVVALAARAADWLDGRIEHQLAGELA